MRKQSKRPPTPRRSTSFALDPYLVAGTWTREEILRARGATAVRPRRSRSTERQAA